MRPLVVVGDALLDRDVEGDVERLSPDAPVPVVDQRSSAPRAGGAGLAAALLAADGRRPVVLVSAVADDGAGAEVLRLLAAAGVQVVRVPCQGSTPEKVRVRASGRTLLRIDRGRGATSLGPVGDEVRRAIDGAAGVLVSDYGGGLTSEPGIRSMVEEAGRSLPVVWDPHPRGALPVPGCRLATPNRREAMLFTDVPGDDLAADVARARKLRAEWRATGVATTLGREGAVVVDGSDTPLRVPAVTRPSPVTDSCGAGDRFAAAAIAVLAEGGLLSDAVVAAVEAASAFVAAGGAAAVGPRLTAARAGVAAASSSFDDARGLAARARARGDVVVATGGCFDLLHAGHVQTLEAARSLGDCLIVCLNSDASVAARKGLGRPVVPAVDRAAVLRGLRCVDAVAVFDEPTPERLLEELRPHVWAKGADYTVADLPEASTVASWGGETVVLPYLDGRSTTELLKEAQRHA